MKMSQQNKKPIAQKLVDKYFMTAYQLLKLNEERDANENKKKE